MIECMLFINGFCFSLPHYLLVHQPFGMLKKYRFAMKCFLDLLKGILTQGFSLGITQSRQTALAKVNTRAKAGILSLQFLGL
jgi:hypothetical protein